MANYVYIIQSLADNSFYRVHSKFSQEAVLSVHSLNFTF